LRNDLRELMRQYPPALAQVLRLDPTLLTNEAYLAPYPTLASFLLAHPEVARNAEYFFGFAQFSGGANWYDPLSPELQLRRDAINAQRRTMEGLTIFGAIAAVTLGVVWLVRLLISHRRWIRATRMQSELNNRLLERMGSSEQLLTYLQSQPGQQLVAAPPVADATPPAATPLTRVLWAVQAGIVLTFGGVGFLVIRRFVIEEASWGILTVGILAIALGLGFVVAAGASYVLSQRFGLFDQPRDRVGESGQA
jgi:hypothetical protein